jgi:hypothetical protein
MVMVTVVVMVMLIVLMQGIGTLKHAGQAVAYCCRYAGVARHKQHCIAPTLKPYQQPTMYVPSAVFGKGRRCLYELLPQGQHGMNK